MASVSIVILNWNGWKDTIECLESIFRQTYPLFKVVVVDNGSADDSVQRILAWAKQKSAQDAEFSEFNKSRKLRKAIDITSEEAKAGGKGPFRGPRVHDDIDLVIIRNACNYGFAGGSNVGLDYVTNVFESDYLLLVNNDVVLEPDFLDCILGFAGRDRRMAIVQGKVHRYNSPDEIDSTGLLADIFGATVSRGGYQRDCGQFDAFIDCGFFYASGAAMVIRRDFLERFEGDGPFDSKLFAYHEDLDICWLARLMNFKIGYCPTARCYHKGSRSFGENSQISRMYLAQRNNLRVLMKNYSAHYLAVILPVTIMIDTTMAILSALYRMDGAYIRILVRSLAWNCRNLADTWTRRKWVQRRRLVTDKEILGFMVRRSIKVDSVTGRRRSRPGSRCETTDSTR
jgi:hypothetical protein